MLRTKLLVLTACLSTAAFAQTETKFPMGDGLDKWGVPLKLPESELSLRLGARFQSLATIETEENLDEGSQQTNQDFQARRVRFQLQADLGTRASFIMDVRNDNANKDDEGEKSFNVGDAYVHIPLSANPSHAVRLYRAKVDVSRTETVSSSELLFVNRPYVADEAANFVSHNRRASNVQMIGHFDKKLSYQVVAGDGIHSSKFSDAKGNALSSSKVVKLKVERQNFMVGGKLRLHPISGWEPTKLTETYFGEGKHASVGIGAFNTSNIHLSNGTVEETVSRNLYNAEASMHYNEFFITSEYFKMDGVIEDQDATTGFNKGTGVGWYVQGEWVFTNYHFLAPFARYEKWNRFIQSGDYETESNMYGVNWYLNGNRFRVSLAYENNLLGRDIDEGRAKVEAFHLASMWHF